MAETPLYTQTVALLEFLNVWTTDKQKRYILKTESKALFTVFNFRSFECSSHKMTSGQFLTVAEELWIEMYERNYIQLDDVLHFQRWLKALQLVGYKFLEQDLSINDAAKPTMNFNVGHSTGSSVTDSPESCKTLPKKTFWTSDLHDGCRVDTPTVLAHLGQKVLIAGVKGSQTPYPFVFNNPNIKMISNISTAVKSKYVVHNHNLKQETIDENFKYFEKDPDMKTVDGFICQFPASMCQLWIPFKKSIMFMPAHR